MNNKGQADYRLASHILLWIAVLIIGGCLIWSAFFKPSEKNIYSSGSLPQETTVNKGFLSSLFEFNLSCIPRGLINKTYNNGVNNAVSTNSQTNSVK
jgi:hypothetical protein